MDLLQVHTAPQKRCCVCAPRRKAKDLLVDVKDFTENSEAMKQWRAATKAAWLRKNPACSTDPVIKAAWKETMPSCSCVEQQVLKENQRSHPRTDAPPAARLLLMWKADKTTFSMLDVGVGHSPFGIPRQVDNYSR